MTRRLLLCGGVLVIACGACQLASDEASSLRDTRQRLVRLEAQATQTGRFQVVNGTPAYARNIMLLDTWTGRTWIACETKLTWTQTNTNWCAMEPIGMPSVAVGPSADTVSAVADTSCAPGSEGRRRLGPFCDLVPATRRADSTGLTPRP